MPTIQNLPVKSIIPNPNQPRKHFRNEEMEELKESFREHGFKAELSHLLVRPANSVRVNNLDENGEEFQLQSEIVYRIEARDILHGGGDWRTVATTTEEDHVPDLLLTAARFELIAGERRWRAAGELGMEKAPCVVIDATDGDVVELALVENLQRSDLNAMEKALAFRSALAMRTEEGQPKYTPKTLARKIGYDEKYVADYLILVRLEGSEAGEAVLDGRLSFRHARAIARLATAALRAELTRKVLRPQYEAGGVMSIASLENLIRTDYQTELRGASFDLKDATLVPVEVDDAGDRVRGGACIDCPHNSANSDESASRLHMCLNTECFRAKTEAEYVQWAAKAAQKPGVVVLSPEEQSHVFDFNGKVLSPNSPYVEITEAPREELKPDAKPPGIWKKLIDGREVPVVLARDEGGKVHELVDRKLAVEAAKMNGHEEIFREDRRAKKSDSAQPELGINENPLDKKAREEAERLKEEAAAKAEKAAAIQEAQIAAVIEAAATGKVPEDFWELAYVALRYCPEVPDCNDFAKLHKEAVKLEVPFRIQAVVKEILLRCVVHPELSKADFPKWGKCFGVDLKAVKKEVEKKFRDEAKAPVQEEQAGLSWNSKSYEVAAFEWNEFSVCTNPDTADIVFPKKEKLAATVDVARDDAGWRFGLAVGGTKWGHSSPCNKTGASYDTRELAAKAALMEIQAALLANDASDEARALVQGLITNVAVRKAEETESRSERGKKEVTAKSAKSTKKAADKITKK